MTEIISTKNAPTAIGPALFSGSEGRGTSLYFRTATD